MASRQIDRTESQAERAYRMVRGRILSGEWTPGQRLSLRPTAKLLGTSLAPVVDAFRELKRDGLIEMEPRWGARVRRLSRDALWNQHIVRTALECEAVRQSACRATGGQLDALATLAESLDALADAHADPQRVRGLDSEFHVRIARLSGSISLVEALKANQLVRLLARGSVIAHDVDLPKRAHMELVGTIRTRDPDVAERAMRMHCVRSMELQLAHMPIPEVPDAS